jgi:hypothetical protein
MPGNVPAINAPLVEYNSSSKPSIIKEADSNGDSYTARWRAATALVSAGGLQLGVIAKTSNFSLLESNYFTPVSASGGAVVVSLPAAATSAGFIFSIKRTDSSVNLITIDGNAAETIDGDLTIFLTVQHETVELFCDGVAWHVMRRYVPRRGWTLKSANFTVDGSVPFYLVTVGAGGVTAILPPAANWKDKELTFKRADSGVGAFVLDGNAAETIDGAVTITLSGTIQRATTIWSDGTNWQSDGNRT